MGAIVGTFGLVRWYTLSFQVTLGSVSDTQTNADLVTTSGLAALAVTVPVSPLRNFLNTTFANAAACDVAFRAIGGEIVVRQVGGTAAPAAIIVEWANANATPSLTYVAAGGASNEVLEVTIRCPHSLVQ